MGKKTSRARYEFFFTGCAGRPTNCDLYSCSVIMAERVDTAALQGMSKKELVVLVQSVAPLELLQANSLSGKPENVAKKANKVQELLQGFGVRVARPVFRSFARARALALARARSLVLARARFRPRSRCLARASTLCRALAPLLSLPPAPSRACPLSLHGPPTQPPSPSRSEP